MKIKFSLVNLIFGVAIIGLCLAWWLDRTSISSQHERRLSDIFLASKTTSRARWISWHYSDLSESNDRYCVARTLILLFEQKDKIESLSDVESIFPAEVYAAKILQAIEVHSVDGYFEWVDEELRSKRLAFPDLGIHEYILPGRDTHESQQFRDFIENAIKHFGNNRIVLPD